MVDSKEDYTFDLGVKGLKTTLNGKEVKVTHFSLLLLSPFPCDLEFLLIPGLTAMSND